MMSASKLFHIQALYSSKTSANVSALTWAISAYNCFGKSVAIIIDQCLLLML